MGSGDYAFDLPLVDEVTVRVAEVGTRPGIMTRARMYAPQAATMAGEILGQRKFAEIASVVLDWDDTAGQQHADLAKKPIIYLSISRFFADKGEKGGWLTIESRIDVDDVFVADILTRSILEDLCAELGEFLCETYRRSI